MDVMLKEFAFFDQTALHCFVKLFMAAICGCIIGIEREVHRKSAGIRTNMMISLGAALYVIAAEMILSTHPVSTDATRMAGQVVVGMGFIGAGAIIQSRGHIVGLTTAATLWVVAAIGVVIGMGFPLFGLFVTLFVVAILVGVGKIEHMVMGKCRFTTTRLSFRDDTTTMGDIEELLATFGKDLTQFHITREGPICFMEVAHCTVHPDHAEWFYELLRIPDVRQTTWHK